MQGYSPMRSRDIRFNQYSSNSLSHRFHNYGFKEVKLSSEDREQIDLLMVIPRATLRFSKIDAPILENQNRLNNSATTDRCINGHIKAPSLGRLSSPKKCDDPFLVLFWLPPISFVTDTSGILNMASMVSPDAKTWRRQRLRLVT